ncbi:SEL1-like repeat protein [Chitinophaga filiformis]|uniref:SEL1-like repeat protein n=1 Tax=Chitinophaga filiformis TaxID=104663 RepID=UPI001F35C5C5|nr:SEL1-like repeat protein [Chitinophaga filiformis]MCF6404499.1 SEL1-like repeat protein [Chitinophaga filiformis]
MAHRIYLYNFNNTAPRTPTTPNKGGILSKILPAIGNNNNETLLMMEWGYEFPFFLHPLFVESPFLAPPLYNGDSGGIYADAAPGIAALKAFYSFIDQHADQLTDNPEEFRAQKEKIFNFLDKKARFNSFHLDAWDVFNMSDATHQEQAKELLELIQDTNACIQGAINANDPGLLDQCPDVQSNPYQLKTFRQFFSNSAYGYGWNVIQSGYFEDEEEEEVSFIENGLMGLKDSNGNILIPAEYDEVFIFPEEESFAVVKRGGKYGYVNRSGQPVTALKYDDAFDTFKGYAIVETGKKQFLIQPGMPEPATGYDDLQLISEVPQLYAVGNDGNYGVIDTSLALRLPFTFRADMDMIHAGEMSLLSAYHTSGTRHFYTPAFTRIGDDSIDNVTWAGTFNDAPLLCISQFYDDKKLRRSGLVTADGRELLPVIYQDISHAHDDVVIVKSNSKYGLYSASKGWLLEAEYNRITLLTEKAFILTKAKKEGLYLADKPVISATFHKIIGNVRWNDDNGWETLALNTDAAFRIDHLGNILQLSSAEVADRLAENMRYLYSEKELNLLLTLAGDDIPSDMLYQKGFDAFEKQQYEDAIRYYKLAAEKGHGGAMNDLGYLYESADGYINETAAFEWYRRGTEAGSPHAANGLANCYINGMGTAPDVNKALELYTQSAAKHVPHAHYNLGMLYFNGEHVEQDDKQALMHLACASRMGYECHNDVGILSERTGDYKNALEAYKAGVKYNDTDCAFNLARMYEGGWVYKPDPRKAIHWYLKAVELGAADAHLEIRRLYLYNDEVKDEAKAMEHEQMARDAGLERGFLRLRD